MVDEKKKIAQIFKVCEVNEENTDGGDIEIKKNKR